MDIELQIPIVTETGAYLVTEGGLLIVATYQTDTVGGVNDDPAYPTGD